RHGVERADRLAGRADARAPAGVPFCRMAARRDALARGRLNQGWRGNIVPPAYACYITVTRSPRAQPDKLMSRRRQIYEGKAKVLFEGPEPGTLVQYFKDDASAFNNKKRGTITGKGVLNNRISEFLMTRLTEIGIPTHFMRRLNMREQLVREVEIIPVAVVVRNVAAGLFAERLGIPEGTLLPRSIIEYYLKKDEL